MRRFVSIILLISSIHVQAQKHGDLKAAYYFDLNKGNAVTVLDLQEASLNVQYMDRYGKDKELELSLFNWKNEKIAQYALSKTFGMNHFKINIELVFKKWEEGEVYSCRAKDEMGNNYELLLRKNTKTAEAPSVNVFVNPLKLSCKELEGNVVDFYAKISGGKAPYTVNWYIVNETKSDFLYQPREEKIERPGKTMVVKVDKDPSYYVMVLVTDACNKEARQMVYLTCSEKGKKINSVFVEPLKSMPVNKTGGN